MHRRRGRGGSGSHHQNRNGHQPYRSHSETSGQGQVITSNEGRPRTGDFRSNSRSHSNTNTRNYENGGNIENTRHRSRCMGFRYIENLLEDDDMEKVVFTLSNDRSGFKSLFETNLTNDFIILIVKLLNKICDSSFSSAKNSVLQLVFQTTFADQLTKYICQIAIQDNNERKRNNYLWKEPDIFWKNLINISKTIFDSTPTFACEVIPKLLRALYTYFPLIEEKHSMHISDELKEDVNNLLKTVEKTASELERKKEIKQSYVQQEELPPPGDFREISVYPIAEEITTDNKPYLRKNIVKGPYVDVNHYLDIQFRLLREDFIAPLRKGICKYLNNSKDRMENIKIHRRVHFLNVEVVNDHNCYRIKYDFTKTKRSFKYENSRKFMFGSLLCFTKDKFKTVLFAKIAQRDIKDLEKGELIVGFTENADICFNEDYVMVESKVYFEPYFQVLNVLKRLKPADFPMEKYIIKIETNTQPPEYLLQIDPVFYEIEGTKFWPLNWPIKRFYSLNDSQHVAFKAALTQELAIIQGPPGTGKTFLGLKIARTLLENKLAWYNRTPMLVICYTNHALDQFLEGITPYTDEILRVGNQSKNEALNKFNLRNHKNRRGIGNSTVAQKRAEVRHLMTQITNINECFNEIYNYTSIIDFTVFGQVIPDFKNTWFGGASNEDIIKWLFSSRDEVHRHARRTGNTIDQITNNFGDMNVAEDTEEGEDTDNNNEFLDDLFDDLAIGGYKSLISLDSIYQKSRTLQSDLEILRSLQRPTLQEYLRIENIEYELTTLERDFDYLKRRLDHARNVAPEEPTFVDLKRPHNMPPQMRWDLYFSWLQQYSIYIRRKKEELCVEFQKSYKVYDEMRDMEDTQTMKDSLVVGMTTTGAARLQSSLQALKSPIVIVEEAAEVLEAHIITALTRHCQHLILIGDHQQLKPSTADYKVETLFNLGISLFERMILNNVQLYTLNVQHRMRPEISCLIKPTIYPDLEDHASVMQRPPILGVEKCLYFIDHQEPEQLCSDNSKKNIHEAQFIIMFAKHLILNGYKPENITILAAYLGQMYELMREKNHNKLILQDVRIAVLDNYQGEECDIILLSLVRSNDEKKIGFLEIENRVCVALSRARNGLYVMGNMSQLCASSEIWPEIKTKLEQQEAIGSCLSLRCQVHPYKITQVKCAQDFQTIPEGGCNLMCDFSLACGHICKSFCHVQNRDHVKYNCREKCPRLLCTNDPAHLCKKLCYEECGPCIYPVNRLLECGHNVEMLCSEDPYTYKCIVKVSTQLPCGHVTDKPCHENPETFICPHPCDVQVQPCGHACTRTCHIRIDPDHIEYKCMKVCAKYRKGCLALDDSNKERHRCRKLCCEECDMCEIEVKKFRTICSHVYKISCYVNVDDIECKKQCTKKLPCGHACKNKCFEECSKCIVKIEKIVPDCKHKVKIRCCDEPERKYCGEKCPRKLACGHTCTKRCSQECTNKCKVLVGCNLKGTCGHRIKKIECHLITAGTQDHDPILINYCTEPCNATLHCKHICKGTCATCFQGRIHVRCSEKCGVPLVCNHECPIPCREACKPCERRCTYKCKHSKCNKTCGEPCTPCKEKCPRRCRHVNCTKFCGLICNVEACDKDCEKLLKCGHQCVGLCGDPCPTLCRTCDSDELTDIFFGDEDDEDARFVQLQDCKHVFESEGLKKWLSSNDDEINVKVCPKCKTTINTTHRYSQYIKQAMLDVSKVKKKLYGSHKENMLKQAYLKEKLDEIKSKSTGLNCLPKLSTGLNGLQSRLKNISNNRRQRINLMDLNALESKLQLIEFTVDTCNGLDFFNDKSETQINFIIDAILKDTDRITNQEIEDIALEINRLRRILQLRQIERTPNFQYAVTQGNVKSVKESVEKHLFGLGKFLKDTDNILHNELTNLGKLVSASVSITASEKREIVRAMGLQTGHWFKCPNGHIYAIGECGGAMQISKCNECGSQIGGQQHRLLDTNQHAPEMDNSQYPAWSEAANMNNYQF